MLYEDLVSSPETVVRALIDWLGLDPDAYRLDDYVDVAKKIVVPREHWKANNVRAIGAATEADVAAEQTPPDVRDALAGSGLYIAYNPINAVLFDRLVAVSGRVANAGFLIYVADSSGYMGSAAVLLWRNFGQASLNWLQFFTLGAYVTSLIGVGATAVAALYFYRRSATRDPHVRVVPEPSLG